MKKLLLTLTLIFTSLSCFADPAFTLFNLWYNGYTTTLVNDQGLQVPFDSDFPMSEQQVFQYSYFYNGQTAMMDVYCEDITGYKFGPISLTYVKGVGLINVTGQCTSYVPTKWDGSPHGTVTVCANKGGPGPNC